MFHFPVFVAFLFLSSCTGLERNQATVNGTSSLYADLCQISYDEYLQSLAQCRRARAKCSPQHPINPHKSVCQVGNEIVSVYVDTFGGNGVPCSVAVETKALVRTANEHLKVVITVLEKLCSRILQ